MNGFEPSRNRSRLAAAANYADVRHVECRRIGAPHWPALAVLCRLTGCNDPRDIPTPWWMENKQ